MDIEYEVRYVEAADLPIGRDWLFVRCGDALYFVVRRDREEEDLGDAAWAAYRELAASA